MSHKIIKSGILFYLWAWAAIPKCRGWENNRTSLLYQSRKPRTEIKGPAQSHTEQPLLLAWRWMCSYGMLTWQVWWRRRNVLPCVPFLFLWGCQFHHQRMAVQTLFNPSHIYKGLTLKYRHTSEVKALWWFEWGTSLTGSYIWTPGPLLVVLCVCVGVGYGTLGWRGLAGGSMSLWWPLRGYSLALLHSLCSMFAIRCGHSASCSWHRACHLLPGVPHPPLTMTNSYHSESISQIPLFLL